MKASELKYVNRLAVFGTGLAVSALEIDPNNTFALGFLKELGLEHSPGASSPLDAPSESSEDESQLEEPAAAEKILNWPPAAPSLGDVYQEHLYNAREAIRVTPLRFPAEHMLPAGQPLLIIPDVELRFTGTAHWHQDRDDPERSCWMLLMSFVNWNYGYHFFVRSKDIRPGIADDGAVTDEFRLPQWPATSDGLTAAYREYYYVVDDDVILSNPDCPVEVKLHAGTILAFDGQATWADDGWKMQMVDAMDVTRQAWFNVPDKYVTPVYRKPLERT